MSLYIPRQQTEAALSEMDAIKTPGDSLYLSDLAPAETTNAVYLGVFRKAFSEAQASSVLSELSADIDAAVFRLLPSSPVMWKTANQLTRTYVASLGCRSLDVLHTAIAVLLNAELFLTFDNR